MTKFTDNLDRVRIAAPCSANWDSMIGTERARHCGVCNLNVYNLSAMTRAEAERLVTTTEGRVCIRFHRRADGTILTQNCPVGVRRLKRLATRAATATLTAALGFFAGLGTHLGFSPRAQAENTGTLNITLPEPLKTPDDGGRVDALMGAAAFEPPPRNDEVYTKGELLLEPVEKETRVKHTKRRRTH